MISLETHLRERRGAGHKLLVPYITAGCRDDWLDVVRAVSLAGVDAIEIGIPFSDPVMDGPVIQQASTHALERGTTPHSVVNDLAGLNLGVPLAVMTYYNLVFRFGLDRFADALAHSDVSGAILPDLPIEMAGDWISAASAKGIETVFLAAPNTPDGRLKFICDHAQGFVYAIGMLGVTGERDRLADSAITLAARIKAVTDKPTLVGVGVSNPEQARQAVQTADGVIIGSALVRRLLDGVSAEEAADFMGEFRTAISN